MRNIFLILPNDSIIEERLLSMYEFDSSVQLTDEQANMFYFGSGVPDGKQRKAGTLDLEDIPAPSNSELFTAEFNALKADHESELNKLNLAFASAALVDGDTQAAKQAEIRTAYNLAVAENQTAVKALMVKYYG